MVIHDFWPFCLEHLKHELPEQQFNTWIKVLKVSQNDSGAGPSIVLEAPNRFVMNWVKERYLTRIHDLGKTHFGAPIEVAFSVSSRLPPVAKPAEKPVSEKSNGHDLAQTQVSNLLESVIKTPDGPLSAALESRLPYPSPPSDEQGAPFPPVLGQSDPPARRSRRKTTAEKPDLPTLFSEEKALKADQNAYASTQLNPDFTFETLVTGKANNMAQMIATQVAALPGKVYNPLFIYGGVGLGKTHLLQALGNRLYHDNPKARIHCIHANDYYAGMVRAYQQQKFELFKQQYQGLDLLLLDDIQFFNRKTRTQEEFFHVFDSLLTAKKQVVITSDTSPKDIEGLSEALVSRLSWGLMVEIEPPELEMRVNILRKKASLLQIALPDDVAFLIANNLRSNVRELEGALNKVQAYGRFHRCALSLEMAREALKDILVFSTRTVTVEEIQKTVADYYKIKVADILSSSRLRSVSRPRQVAMYLARELTSMALPALGGAFGGRTHTTVLHACKSVSQLCSENTQVRTDVHVLTQTLLG
jgi:chromosomal replication initiator protein